jgi:ATP-binding cassette subfamily F protein uup
VNLISLEKAAKAYAHRTLLDGVSLGVSAGDRVGVVGRNGAGKSTLLGLLAGRVTPDSGRVAMAAGLRLGYLPQGDNLTGTVGEIVFGAGASSTPWEADPRARAIMTELLPGIGLDAPAGQLSGGERRRVALASLLVAERDVLLLDEPTNHLDIEASASAARKPPSAAAATWPARSSPGCSAGPGPGPPRRSSGSRRPTRSSRRSRRHETASS